MSLAATATADETLDQDGSDTADGEEEHDEELSYSGDDSHERGHHPAESQEQSTSGRRGKRKGTYTEEERRYRRRLANRESARRMRAKRNEAVKDLETTVVHLKDRNKQLEKQNKEYAKSLHKLQSDMVNLQTQLQDKLSSLQQQQQSSSEMQQVLSSGTAMHPRQQGVLPMLTNTGSGMCFSGQVSFSGAVNGLPVLHHATADAAAAALAAEQQQHRHMRVSHRGDAMAVCGQAPPQQQLEPQQMHGLVPGGNRVTAETLLSSQQQLWQMQTLEQQTWQQQQQHVQALELQSWQQLQQQNQQQNQQQSTAAHNTCHVGAAPSASTGSAKLMESTKAPLATPFASAATDSMQQGTQQLQRQRVLQALHTVQQQQPARALVKDLLARQMYSKSDSGGTDPSAARAPRLSDAATAAALQWPHQLDAPQRQCISSGPDPAAVAAAAAAAAPRTAAVSSPLPGQQLFPAAAEELLNELLMGEVVSAPPPSQQPSPAGQTAAASGAADGQDQQQLQAAQPHDQPGLQQQARPSGFKPLSGFKPWTPKEQHEQAASDRLVKLGQGVTAAGMGVGGPPSGVPESGPAAWHGLLQQTAAAQRQQQQQERQAPAGQPLLTAGAAAAAAPAGSADQQPGAPAAAASVLPAAAAGPGDTGASAAAAMLAARGRAFAVGFGNQMSFCGFEVPEVEPAVVQPEPRAAGGAGAAAAAPADPLETWTRRHSAPAAAAAGACSTADVLHQLGGALQLEAPEPLQQLSLPAAGLAGVYPASQQLQRRSSNNSGHSSGHRQQLQPYGMQHHVLVDPEVARKPKRRFPLKRPSRLAAQHAAVVAAAAAAAAGFTDGRATSTVCEGSCGDWPASGTALQVQLEQQKRRRLRRQLHAPAAPVGAEAERILTCGSRVGPPAAALSDDQATGAVAAGDDGPEHSAHTEATGGGGGAAAASPTSRHTQQADVQRRQYSGGLWQAPEAAACMPRAHSSLDPRLSAFSVPGGFAGQQPQPEHSTGADGCRSYASEPGVDAADPVAAALRMLDWAEGCSAPMEQWERQLHDLQRQFPGEGLLAPGQLPGNGPAAAGGARPVQGLAQHNATPAAMAMPGLFAPDARGPVAVGATASPGAVAVLHAAAGQHAGDALATLSPQLQQLQQQLQHYMRHNRGVAPAQQQQQPHATGGTHQHLARHGQAPQQAASNDVNDHAVPGSPLGPEQGSSELVLPWQQPHLGTCGVALRPSAADAPGATAGVQGVSAGVGGHALASSHGPAAAAVPAPTAGTQPCISRGSPHSAATSPKGAASVGAGPAATSTPPLAVAGAGAGGQAAGLQHTNSALPGPPAEACNIGTAGIDIGDLDLPESPPELDALLAAMLQHEQHEQGAGGSRQQQGPAASPQPASRQPSSAGHAMSAGASLQEMPNQGGVEQAPLQAPCAATAMHALARASGSAGGSAPNVGASAAGAIGRSQPGRPVNVIEAAMQDQLRLELTEASAGLQGLWLDPAASEGVMLQRPVGINLNSAAAEGNMSLGLSRSPPAACATAAPAAAPAAAGPDGGWESHADPGLGAVSVQQQQQQAAAANPAATAAAEMAPWSWPDDQQQQWFEFDDIFAPGPTLPHELGSTTPP